MAINNYENSVPLGREGTGAAQILGPNRALQYFLGQNQRQQDRLLGEQQRYQQQQERYNAQFNKQLMELGELAQSPMYSQDFAELTNQLMKQGGELMSQGINPYNPYQNETSRAAVQQWQGEVNKLRSAKTAVEALKKTRDGMIEDYLKNPSDYEFDDYKKIRDFENEVSLDDIMNGQTNIPQLSKKLNIGQDFIKKYGEVYRERTEMTTDEAGNPMRSQIREVDTDRIKNIVNSDFNANTPYGQEVNRRLRRQFGDSASMDGLLGTTNRDEIRQILDAEFRNPSENNPIVELRANGVNARPGTPEYDSFLESAVNEQLQAELILDDAKQEAASALMGNTNTRRTDRLDFTVQREADRRQAFATSERNKNASYQNTLLSIQKKQSSGDDEADAMSETAVDIDFSEDYGDGEVESGITVWGAIPLNTASVSISPATTTDVKTGGKVKQNEIRGNISAVGVVGYDSKGNVVQGSSPEELLKNPKVVKFEPQVIIQDNKKQSHSYNVNNIPVSSLSKPSQANVKKAISVQGKVAKQLNDQLGKRPKSGKTDTQSWNNYQNSLNSLWQNPTGNTNTNTNNKKKIDW